MQKRHVFKWLPLLTTIVGLFLCGPRHADAFITQPYGDFSGATIEFYNVRETTNSYVHETDVEDPAVLYGAPMLLPGGDQLLFFPSQYSSSSTNGQADTTSGHLQIFLQAKPGHFIETVRFREFGDYALSGAGSGGTQAHPSGSLFVTPLDGFDPDNGFFPPDPKGDSDGKLFADSPSDGRFSLSWEVDFTGYGVTMAMLSFNNTLQTSSEAGTTAFLQKKGVSGPAVVLAVNQQPVPVPAAGLLLGTGLAGLWLIRRNRVFRGK